MRAPVFARAGTSLYVNLANVNTVAVGLGHPEATEPRAIVSFAGENGQAREVFRGADAIALSTMLELLSSKPGADAGGEDNVIEMLVPVELYRLLAEEANRLGLTVEESVTAILAGWTRVNDRKEQRHE